MTRTFNRLITTLLAGTALTTSLGAAAGELPTGASVAHGAVGISMPGPNAMAIQQTSQTAIVNWQTFSIGQGARVDVAQPNASAALLSRVTGSTPSTIAGQLNANGQVYLVNPNGIVITNTGVVRAGAFVGSTLGISDEDFKAGRRTFKGNGASATVSNQGSIDIAQGGFAALLGGRVDNSGVVSVPLGRVGFGAGEQATLDLSGDGFLQVAVPSRADGSSDALIRHSGRINAAGGRVEMQAATARDMARNAINLSGLVEARTVSGRSGAIVLGGGEGGSVTVSGRLNASASARPTHLASRAAKAARGGEITVTGDTIQFTGARLSADGASGGGRIRVGGDLQGGGTLQRASVTRIDAATTISANAGASGQGGDVVVWSDRNTQFAGTISARGGASMGDGGSAEVSSKGVLAYTGSADLSAAHGAFGTLLLDPYNVFITNGATTGQTQGASGFTPNADDSVINAGALATALATANVTVTTGNAGGQAGDIAVRANVAWSAPTSLTLSAARNITVGPQDVSSSPPSISVPTGGGLVLRADNAGTGIGTVSLASNAIVAADTAAVSVYYNPASNPAGSGINPTSYANPTTYTATVATSSGVTTTRPVASYMLVNTAADLQNMGNTLAGSYALGRDFSVQGANFNGGVGFTPIGTAATPFTGNLDGQGRTISNLTVARSQQDYAGLFGSIQNGTVQNLNLTNVSVTGGSYVGGLAGQVVATDERSATITNVSVAGRVIGTASATGVPSFRVGGLIGYLSADGTLADTGPGARATVTGAFSTAAVSAPGSSVGGLIGGVDARPRAATASVSSSYASGAVSGGGDVGGLVGLATTGPLPPESGRPATVGLDQTYATGLVVAAGAGTAGGLVGRSTPAANAPISVTQSYWDTQTSGRTTSAGGTGQSTAQLQGTLPAGFDGAVWRTQANAYPFLAWRFPNGVLAISGTALAAADPGTPLVGAPISIQAGGTAALTTQSNANGTYYAARDPLTGTAPQGVAVVAVDGARTGARVTDAPVGAASVTSADVRIDRAILSSQAASTTDLGNLLTAITGGPSVPATTAIQAFSTTLPAIYIEALNPAGFTVDQTIAVGGRLQIAGLGSGLGAATSAGPVTIAAGRALQSGNSDVIVATSRFTDNAGATGIQAAGRFLVYSNDYAADQRGGLAGGNLYNRTFAGNPPATITQAGSQFIYSRQPTLTVGVTDSSREYGAPGGPLTSTVTGLVNGDTAAQAYTGSPALTDTTTLTTGVGTYAGAARSGLGSLASSIGYAFSFTNGSVSVTPAPLTITANDATKAFGSTLTFTGTEFTVTGLRNTDQVTRVTLTSDGAPAAATVAGSPYPIVASNAVGTGLIGNAASEGAPGASNYNVRYVPGSLTLTQPAVTPLAQATTAPSLDRQLSNTFIPITPRTDTLDIANLDGGGPSLGVGEASGAKGATLAYLTAASAELDAAVAACERQDQRRTKAYTTCVSGALDAYASKLELRLTQLPPAFRNIPAVVRQAAQKIRVARTITEARQAVRVAVVAVRKAIALIRADEPAVAQRQKREGNAIASALQSVDNRLSKSVGL